MRFASAFRGNEVAHMRSAPVGQAANKLSKKDSDMIKENENGNSKIGEAERARFKTACEEIIGGNRAENGIGTLSEKTLHAVLKRYFELDGGICEIKFGRYVADVVLGERGIFEIQTRAFNVLRNKLDAF